MAILIKFLSIPLYPLGLVITLLIASTVIPNKARKLKKALFVASLLFLYLFSIEPVSRFLARGLEMRYDYRLPSEAQDASAIVILGGGGRPIYCFSEYPEINSAGDRILHGARLFKDSLSPRIIVTGGHLWSDNIRTSEAYHHSMLLTGLFDIDSSNILLEPKARNTYEHGPYVEGILDSLELPREIILVTSAAHMPRSVAVFKKRGFTVFPAPIDYYGRTDTFQSVLDFFPKASALDISTKMMHEYYGWIGYKLLGWI
ncbi:YdcF family protein [Chitinispirillales bacterium ANBcel5]|uniref:YdcF family protein n=1 Tax=Cellulosispirillum alkaliphilum TaxID=3039283 RepID=UPI002A543957|nr:YdcF family protein [Chitinispirillales bacterium ANBcel5]